MLAPLFQFQRQSIFRKLKCSSVRYGSLCSRGDALRLGFFCQLFPFSVVLSYISLEFHSSSNGFLLYLSYTPKVIAIFTTILNIVSIYPQAFEFCKALFCANRAFLLLLSVV